MASLSTKAMQELYGGGRDDDDNVVVLDRPLDQILAETKARPKRAASPAIERERMERWLDAKIAGGESVCIETLTPVLATLLMERNPINRKIVEGGLALLRSDIVEKRFKFNGDPVRVSVLGWLLDGQHRCQSVIDTGIPIRTVFVFGLDDESRYTMDIGTPKQVSTFLQMKGRAQCVRLAAAAALVAQWELSNRLAKGGRGRPTKQQILAAEERHPDLIESLHFCGRAESQIVATVVVLAFCHYAIWQRAGRERADAFMDKLILGHGLRPGDPILTIRNRLQRGRAQQGAHERASLIFQAWNASRKGGSMSNAKVTPELPKLAG